MSSQVLADEQRLNVEAVFVTPRTALEANLKFIKRGFEDKTLTNKEFYFGTNAYLSFSSYEEFEQGVIVKECSEAFYNEFRDLTNGVGFNILESMMDFLSEDERD